MAELTFINHASYIIESNNSLLITDPWVEGKAFDNGWALLDGSTTNQMLVEYMAQIGKKNFIWLSHEHSDHFSVPFLKKLKENKIEASFIFQKTLDGRVANFIRNLGFKIIESNDNLKFLDSEISIVTFPHQGGDSFCLTKIGDFSILNINDCVINDKDDAERVSKCYKKYTNDINLLFTQFGYANWVGNKNEQETRKSSAEEKLNRITFQIQKFTPDAMVPFASFIYFCDPENFHTNDCQNTPQNVLDHFEKNKFNSKLIVLKPWDKLNLAKDLNQKVNERSFNISHWAQLFSGIEPYASLESNSSLEEILETYKFYRKKIFRHFLIAPYFLEKLGFIDPISFYLNDLKKNILISYCKKPEIKDGDKSSCDIALSSKTLEFTLKNEYGANTTGVNGKLERISRDGFAIFLRHFSPQEYMKMGYGLAKPIVTLKIGFGKLVHKLFFRKWSINPTPD